MNKYYLKYVKPWRKRNPEKVKEYQKRWRKKNPEKVKIIKQRGYWKWRGLHPYKIAKPGTSWDIVRLKVLARDDCICRVCGKDAGEVHHLDGTGSNKKAKEMNNDLVNLITVCHKCHMKLDVLKQGNFSKGKWQEDKERDDMIMGMLGKFSQSRISRIMGITRQRVGQIVKRREEIEASL